MGSLLLSLVALQKSTLNRDGMLYVETAQVFLEEGLGAAAKIYSWPFLPILMAGTSSLTGFDLEQSGHLLNALFIAGACGLLVASAKQIFPEALWHICFVVLALPAVNGYRDELLREYGCWFFIMLSFWLALRWTKRPSWFGASVVQLPLFVATLFRPEALVLILALVLWQLFEAEKNDRWRRAAKICSLTVAMLIPFFFLFISDQSLFGRLAKDVQRLDFARFSGMTENLASLLHRGSQNEAAMILLVGLLSLVPIKFASKMGLFLIPLAWSFKESSIRAVFQRCRVFTWAFIVYFSLLAAFVVEMQYLSGRYIAPLALFSAPLAGYGYWLILRQYRRAGVALGVLFGLVMIGNVISLQAPKLHFVEAGKWLAANTIESGRIYVGSGRTAYYAGWHFKNHRVNRAKLQTGLAEGKYDLVVLEVSAQQLEDASWLEKLGLVQVAKFSHPGGDAVVIAKPVFSEEPLK